MQMESKSFPTLLTHTISWVALQCELELSYYKKTRAEIISFPISKFVRSATSGHIRLGCMALCGIDHSN